MRELLDLAWARGIAVEWAPLGPVRGIYEHPVRTITLNSKMPSVLLKSTLAHELGHAHYGHTAAAETRIRERQERLANRFAASLLITPEAYEAAEVLHGSHLGAVALELDVARYVVETWHEMHRLDQMHRRYA